MAGEDLEGCSVGSFSTRVSCPQRNRCDHQGLRNKADEKSSCSQSLSNPCHSLLGFHHQSVFSLVVKSVFLYRKQQLLQIRSYQIKQKNNITCSVMTIFLSQLRKDEMLICRSIYRFGSIWIKKTMILRGNYFLFVSCILNVNHADVLVNELFAETRPRTRVACISRTTLALKLM